MGLHQPASTTATVAEVERRGGLAAIAISHPHYYTGMVEWSRAFGGVPIYLHADDRAWVMRPDPAIALLGRRDARAAAGGLTADPLRRALPGQQRCSHWAAGAEGAARC